MSHRPQLADVLSTALLGMLFATLTTAASPSRAQGQPGARCPADTPSADYTAQFTNNTLRCQRRSFAQAFCPPTQPHYHVLPGMDSCSTINIIVPPPGTLTVPVQCPPNMSIQINGGQGDRDRCRSNNFDLVMPLLGMY